MADRTVKVNLLANVVQYERDVESAADATDDLRRKAERFDGKTYRAKLELDKKQAEKALKDLDNLSKKMSAEAKKREEKSAREQAEGLKRNVKMRMDAFWTEVAEAQKAADAKNKAHGDALAQQAKMDAEARKARQRADAEDAKNRAKQAEAYNKAWADALKENSSRDVEAAKVRVDTTGAKTDLVELRKELAAFDRAKATPEVNLKIDKALLDARKLEVELDRLSTMEATPEADLKADKVHFEINAIKREIEALNAENARIIVKADTQAARLALDKLKQDLNGINMTKVSPEADLKIQKFRAQAAAIERELMRLDGMEASADVDIRTAEAMAKLAAINAELRRFDGQTFTSTVNIQTRQSHSRLAMITSAVAGMTPVIAAMAASGGAAIVGLTGTLSILAAGAAVAGLAFSGMGTALEAANEYALDPSAKNAEKLKNAIGLLNDAQREFYFLIQNQMRPAIEQLQQTASRGMLPGVTEGLRELLQVGPQINTMVGQVAAAMGELARASGDALNDGVWQKYIAFLGNEARPQLLGFGAAIGKTIEGLAAMQMAFNPFTQDIINGLRQMATEFSNWAQSLEGSAEFKEFLDYCRTVGPQVMDTFGALAGAIASLIEAGAPLAPFFLQMIETFADFVSAVAGIPVVGTALIGLAAAIGVLTLALRASAAIQASRLYTGLMGLGGAANTAKAGLTGVGATAAGTAGGMGAAAGAATRTGGAMGALVRAGGAVARNLPIVGAVAFGVVAAYDAMNVSVSEGASALTDTGLAAAKTRGELLENDRMAQQMRDTYGNSFGDFREWINGMTGAYATTAQATAEIERQIAAMTPLEAATARQQIAQNQYNDAVVRFGQNSPQAIEAMHQLSLATENTAVQQELAGLSGQAFYDKLRQLMSVAGPAGDAATRFAGGLNLTDLAAMGATISINQAGQAIATMPDGKVVALTADASNATYQINMVNGQLLRLPLNTMINVGVLGEPAVAALRSLGIEVNRLPDGTVEVTAHDEAARAKLSAFVAFGNEQRANPTLDANTEPGRQRLLQLINEANMARGVPMINANSAEGRAVLDQMIASMNASSGTAQLNANDASARITAETWRLHTEGLIAMPLINANANLAYDQAYQWNNDTMSLEPVPNVNANTGPAWGQSFQWNAQTQSLQPVPSVNAETSGADARSRDWESRTDAMNPEASVRADTSSAQSSAQGFWNSWAGKVITWFVRLAGPGQAYGNVLQPMAEGGVTNAARTVIPNADGNNLSPYNREYAGKKLRNMPNVGAQMVQPNTWRVVGDRMDVPELYAPLDGSGRSLSLIAQGAQTFGKALVDIEAMRALTQNKFTSGVSANIPRSVNVPREMAMAGGGGSSHNVTNNVVVNNPIAERASDSVQSRLSRLADLGLFGDD